MTAAELRAHRRALGLSQLQLARALGVDHSTVFRWEQGTRAVPPLLALALEALARRAG